MNTEKNNGSNEAYEEKFKAITTNHRTGCVRTLYSRDRGFWHIALLQEEAERMQIQHLSILKTSPFNKLTQSKGITITPSKK